MSRRKAFRTTVRDRDAPSAPDLGQRDFTVPAPNRLWVADITYLPTGTGFLYLPVVVDAFSRRVVGWAMAQHLLPFTRGLGKEVLLDPQRRKRSTVHKNGASPNV